MPESSNQDETEPNAEETVKKYDIRLISTELNKPRQDMAALAYIAGYCANIALKRKPCDDCRNLLTVTERGPEESDHVLIERISRGGLKFPQPAVIHTVLCAKVVFDCITSKGHEPVSC